MKHIVKVTKADIENGVREESRYCPVALALRRTFKTRSISAGPGILDIREQCVWTPERVSCFIRDFDKSKPVKSFQFTLEL